MCVWVIHGYSLSASDAACWGRDSRMARRRRRSPRARASTRAPSRLLLLAWGALRHLQLSRAAAAFASSFAAFSDALLAFSAAAACSLASLAAARLALAAAWLAYFAAASASAACALASLAAARLALAAED
jgi:hypothetical protein